MKIALVCTEKLPVPPVAGGAVQLYIEGILPYLSDSHSITVYSVTHPSLPSQEIRGNIRYVRVPGNKAAIYIENVKKVMDQDFDLIHVFNRPLWVLVLSREFPSSRFSLSLHNEMFHTEKLTNAEAVQCVEKVEFINTVSRFIAEGVRKRVPQAAGKLHVVYSGADVKAYTPAWSQEGQQIRRLTREKLGLKGKRVILFVGRFSNKKGAHILLQAMKSVMKQYPDTALVMVGSKWYGENQEDEYTRHVHQLVTQLPGPVVMTGFIPPSEVPAYYSAADIFVCPSQWNEPLARVHYEAMAAGLPIITTNRGGNSEVVAGLKNGMVVDDFANPEAFTRRILYLLENKSLCLEMGKTGRRLAEERFNWQRVAAEVLKPVTPEPFSSPRATPEPKDSIPPPAIDFEW